MKTAIGVDLGGTKLYLAVVDSEAHIREEIRLPTPVEQGGDAILELLSAELEKLIARHPVTSIGIGTPGLVDFPSGTILGCTPNLPGWEKRSLREVLQHRLQKPVVVDNDANVAAWGEYCHSFRTQASSLVMLTLGTGLGSGMIWNDHLLRGHRQLGIGFGHMIVEPRGRMCNCGQQGCLEAYVSGNGLLKGYRLRGGATAVKGPEIFIRAAQGETAARATVTEFLDLLALGIVNILNTLAPEYLVLGGGISQQGEEILLQPVRERIGAIMGMPFRFPEMVTLARLGPSAGVIGAALLALKMDEQT
jgi:glucokinase